MTGGTTGIKAGATRRAGSCCSAINLFNYIDRYVLAAVEPRIRATFFAADDPNAMAYDRHARRRLFSLPTCSRRPLLGWMADRFSRWLIVGSCVIFWSIATASGGLAATFFALLLTRIFVGIGEGGYGPAAPTILADIFRSQRRGRIMAIFCAAIPVGSALGYVIGGVINAHLGWRWAFYIVGIPGPASRAALLFAEGSAAAAHRDANGKQRARKKRLSHAPANALLRF